MKKLSEMTDEGLALSYINGDNRAFDLLLSRNQSKLFSYILFVVRNRDVADDIFQETFVKIITKLQEGRYKPSGKFSAWAMRIAHNVIMDWYRAQKSDKIVEPTKENDLSNIGNADVQIGNIENQFVNMQTLADIQKMMEHLPASQREVVFYALLSGNVVQRNCQDYRCQYQHESWQNALRHFKSQKRWCARTMFFCS